MSGRTFSGHLTWSGAAKGPTVDPKTYSRDLIASVEGKADVQASAHPSSSFGMGDPTKRDPEDFILTALMACHALTYLALCAKVGVKVVAYEDNGTGELGMIDGHTRVANAVLRPKVIISADSDEELALQMHEKAHKYCTIANSVNFPVTNEPEIVVA